MLVQAYKAFHISGPLRLALFQGTHARKPTDAALAISQTWRHKTATKTPHCIHIIDYRQSIKTDKQPLSNPDLQGIDTEDLGILLFC